MSTILIKRFLSILALIFPAGLISFTSSHLNSPISSSSAFSYSLLQGSKVSIRGSTNVNDFVCFSQETYSPLSGNFFINDVRNTITFEDVILNVRAESFECGNVVMNKNLCQTLRAEKYPFIIVAPVQAGSKNGEALNFFQWTHMTCKLYITLAGERRLQQIDFVAKQTSDGTYHFIGEHNISLSQYHLNPPSALFGLVKVKDIIIVKFDLVVQANASLLE